MTEQPVYFVGYAASDFAGSAFFLDVYGLPPQNVRPA
jgi:hypothetical protein